MATFTAEKPKLSNLRERLLNNKLGQVEHLLKVKEDELQFQRSYIGLSPALIDRKQFELDALRDLKANLIDGLETVARQSVRQLPAEEDDEDVRIGGWRSQRAYFDNLERERAKLSPLSRAQYERAKEISAKRARFSRRGVDVNSQDVLREEHPTWFTQNMGVPEYMFAKATLTGVDPCLDAKRVRREVMFAQRSAGKGYRGKRGDPRPC